MGAVVASLMNSTTSRTCVQLASLASRTPSDVAIERPLAQIPPKPASSTIFAERPLWASIRKESSALSTRRRSLVVFLVVSPMFPAERDYITRRLDGARRGP
jgi:hypothetical protein